ncbi:MAG: type 4a pilus biogenesis protein PilO [Myxococcota bacterium]|nr:type 4a pilus biogenesis protein PilO [Myxococcota bacterium]
MATAKSSGDQSFARLPAAAKAGLGVGLVALICAVYYFALHLSLDEDIEGARFQHVQLETRMTQARERNAEYVRLREQLSQREGLDRANLRALPQDAETAAFLQDLNRIAELSGLQIRLVEPRPEEPDEHYVKLPVSLQLTGKYHQVSRFFYNVSRLDRLISMENIHLSNPRAEANEQTDGSTVVDVDVLATTYRRPDEPEPQAAAPAPAAAPGT